MFGRRTLARPAEPAQAWPSPSAGAGKDRLVAAGFDVDNLLARGLEVSESRLQLTAEVRAKHNQLLREQDGLEERAREAGARQQQWVMVRELVRGIPGAAAEEVGRATDAVMQGELSQCAQAKTAAEEKAGELLVTADLLRALAPEPAPPTCSICFDAPVREAAPCGHNFCSGCILGMVRCHVCQRQCGARDFRTLYFC